jgi:hypothetical protein
MIPDIFNGKKKEETKERPESGTIELKGKSKDSKKLRSELGSLSMFQGIKEEDGSVKAMVVESMDRNKKPYKYISFTFSKDGAKAYYSIPPEVPNPTLRRLQVTKSVFTILSMLEARGVFLPDREELYSRTMEAFDLGAAFADADTLKAKYMLERYAVDNSKMKAELAKLKEEKEGLDHELLELEKRCQALEDKLGRMESMTDRELDREIVKWVEDHYGKLNEERFCESFGVPAQRLEERLDSLSKRGVIRIA